MTDKVDNAQAMKGMMAAALITDMLTMALEDTMPRINHLFGTNYERIIFERVGSSLLVTITDEPIKDKTSGAAS